MNKAVITCLALVLSLAAGAPAQPAMQQAMRGLGEPEMKVVSLTLTPRAPQRPALRDRLMLFPGDQVPGNAAPLYLLAIVQLSTIQDRDDDLSKITACLNAPMAKFDQAEARRLVNRYGSVFDQLEQATLRDSCQWELPVRQEGIRTLLPQLQQMRFISSLIALNARLSIARHDYPAAIHWLQAGYTLVHNLDQQAVLIQGLVAAVVAKSMNQVAMDFVQAPDAPNLYWPLTNLPSPLLDFRGMLGWERSWIAFTVPAIKNVHGSEMTAEQWQRTVTELMGLNSGPTTGSAVARQMAAIAVGMRMYPTAKAYLAEHGYTPAQVAAMPVPRVLGTYIIDSYESAFDEVYKWAALPYWRARTHLQDLDRQLAQERDSVNPLMMTLPAISRVQARLTETDREVSVLRTIEAIRAYAASHAGRMPEDLEDMLDPPAAIDPFTGSMFNWKSGGNAGVLTLPPVPGEMRIHPVRYEITIR